MPSKQAAIPFKRAGKTRISRKATVPAMSAAGNGPPRTPPTGARRPPRWRAFLANPWLAVAIGVTIWNVYSLMRVRPAANPVVDIPYSIFLDQLDGRNVSQVDIQGNGISGSLKAELTYPP